MLKLHWTFKLLRALRIAWRETALRETNAKLPSLGTATKLRIFRDDGSATINEKPARKLNVQVTLGQFQPGGQTQMLSKPLGTSGIASPVPMMGALGSARIERNRGQTQGLEAAPWGWQN